MWFLNRSLDEQTRLCALKFRSVSSGERDDAFPISRWLDGEISVSMGMRPGVVVVPADHGRGIDHFIGQFFDVAQDRHPIGAKRECRSAEDPSFPDQISVTDWNADFTTRNGSCKGDHGMPALHASWGGNYSIRVGH
jgi:hypothetical protein